MRRLAILVLAMGAATQAAEAKVTWTGMMCITSVASACPAGDWEIACYNMRYRPAGVSDNGAATHFSFGNENFRYGLDLASGSLIGTTYKAVSQTTVTAFGFTAPNTSLRFTTQKPVTLTETTNAVEIVGNIKNIDGGVGCNLGFRAAGVRAP
jgi:hypothetical protein